MRRPDEMPGDNCLQLVVAYLIIPLSYFQFTFYEYCQLIIMVSMQPLHQMANTCKMVQPIW